MERHSVLAVVGSLARGGAEDMQVVLELLHEELERSTQWESASTGDQLESHSALTCRDG